MLAEGSLVSIVVPCYNAASVVEKTIRSVIAQTYQNWELILIDDGSKDNIAEVVKPFLEDTRIHFHVQNNQGVSAARNNAIALAKGELIAFLDSDDIWLPEKLQRQVEIFHQYPDIGVCAASSILIDMEDKITHINKGEDFYGQASAPFVSRTLTIPQSSTVIRKTACGRINTEQGYLFDPAITSLSEDFDFWLRCSALFPFYKIGEPLVQHRVWQGNTTKIVGQKRQDVVINEIIPRFCNQFGGSRYIRPHHIRQLKSVFYHERGSHSSMTWFAATYWFIRSLLCNPRNRDSWGALGHQLLPEVVYHWLVNRITRRG